jgi:hypothetical protein
MSAPGAWKSKKSKKNSFFTVFWDKILFFSKPWQFFSFFMFTTHIRTKKSQVVEYNIIQMLTQNLVEVFVGIVCGPGDFFFSITYLFSETLILKIWCASRARVNLPYIGNRKCIKFVLQRFFLNKTQGLTFLVEICMVGLGTLRI